MKAKEYLERIKKLDALLEDKLAEHDRWVEIAKSMGAFSTGEKVQSTKKPDKMADAVAHYVDLEKESIDELLKERATIINTIELLPLIEYKVLYMLFVQRKDFYDIAKEYGKSYSWATTMKGNAMKRLQGILDEREKNKAEFLKQPIFETP